MIGSLATAAGSAALVVLLAFADGGYFPSEWGLLAGLFALVLLAASILADRTPFDRRGAVLVAALAGLAAWCAVSGAWSAGWALPVQEAERVVVYLAAAAALLAAVSRERVPALLFGLAAGIVAVAVYALATRLAPGSVGGAYDPSSGYQLAAPVGYWNTLGILVALGVLLTAGIALHAETGLAALASAALVPLACALYFTFSRGALAALAAGLAALVLLESSRLRAAGELALLAVVPALGVAAASRPDALNRAGFTLDQARDEGARLGVTLGVLAVAAVAVGVLVLGLERRVRAGRALRLAAAALVLVVLAAAAGGGIQAAGGPQAAWRTLADRFREEPPATEGDVGRRLLSLSGTGRADYWDVAWGMVERGPLLGEGAGAFERRWLRERPVANGARDAHNLYLETLAELGLVGLGLLAAVLATPLTAVRGARAHPLGATAAAGLIAFCAHAFVDWDWEVPLVTLVALACGTALVTLARDGEPARFRGGVRALAVAGAAVLLGAAFVVHVGNRAAAASADALDVDAAAAARHAGRARAWQPWSAEPLRLQGEAELARRADAAATRLLRRAIERDAEDWVAWYDLALVTTGAEQRTALLRAAALNPLGPELAELREELRTES